MAFVEFKNVYKTYKMGELSINAVDGVNFCIEKGEFVVVVGSSGAGKTTVLNMLGGMDNCSGGTIIVNNKDISRYSKKQLVGYRRKDIGFVFQFYNLIPNLTAKENIELATQLCKDAMSPEEALRSVGLADRMDNFPAQLSGCEQQRVSIARALAKRPALFLCDEPTGALDYKTGKSILKLLQTTCEKEGMTVVLITHNSAITPMAHRVITMKSGKTVSNVINNSPVAVENIEW